MFNRKNAALVATILGGLCVAALLVATLANIDFRHNESNSLTPTRVEMMPEGSPEFNRKHFTGPDGKDLKVVVAYRNGDTGFIFYRKDGTLSEFVVVFPDGKTDRKHSTFDPSGKVLTAGFEVRKNGSKVWVTEPLASGVIRTVTYWQDGTTVFSEALRTRTPSESDKVETKYLRPDGTVIARLVTGGSSGTDVLEEDVYGDTGKIVRSRRTPDGVGGTVEYFRADGTLHFRQTYERSYSYGYGYGGGYYGGEGGYSPPSPSASLKLVTVFGADGKTPVLELGQDYSKTVATWDKKGIKTIRYLSYDGTVSRVEYVKDGSTTTNNKPTGADAKVPEFDSAALTVAMPAAVNPVVEWKKAEDAAAEAAVAQPPATP